MRQVKLREDAMKTRTVVADLTALGKHSALQYNDRPTGRERRCRLEDQPIGGRLANRRVGLAVIAGLASALAGVAAAQAAAPVTITTCR